MLNGYPRPQLERKEWLNLNGEWQFLFDDEKRGEKEKWYEHFLEETGRIQVPYTYETKYSGIGEEKFHPVVWYHREIEIDRVENRRLLHFEGIDYIAKVWVNGQFVGMHTGGYARFTIDISDYIVPGKNSITVRAEDSMSCVQPRGKQRWKTENFGCWYVQTTGIWKTVWMEEVPDTYLERVKLTPDIDEEKVRIEVKLNHRPEQKVSLNCEIRLDENEIAVHTVDIRSEYARFDVKVSNPEEPWGMVLWSPENPKLYDMTLRLSSESGEDEARSYFGMREISIQDGKVLLNHVPLYQRLILDQGYWEESHLTPPSEEALIKEIDLIMAAGYNGLRKHEKTEDERFLYWCDKKGLLVWCEMPSTYAFHEETMDGYTPQWLEIVKQNYNHPCIITWTAFNESWGVEQIFTDKRQQQFTEGIYHLTKAYDMMRPVIVNDGWEHTMSDLLTLHDYEEDGERFMERYQDKEAIVGNKIPFNGAKYAFAKGYAYRGQPVLISEYGGIAFTEKEGWGYGRQVNKEEEFLERFQKITDAIKKTDYVVGFCYTQVTDVQQEINGLYTKSREPKVTIEKIRKINED